MAVKYEKALLFRLADSLISQNWHRSIIRQIWLVIISLALKDNRSIKKVLDMSSCCGVCGGQDAEEAKKKEQQAEEAKQQEQAEQQEQK